MFGDLPQVLAAIRNLRRELAQARTLAKIKSLRDNAEGIREYAKRAPLGLKTSNEAAEVKLQAERKAGHLLATMTLSHGGRPARKNRSKRAISLGKLGINKSQSSRWQLAASVAEKAFRQYVVKTKKAGEEITTEGLLRLARELRGDTKSAERAAKLKKRTERDLESHDEPGLRRGESPGKLECREALEKLTEAMNHQKLIIGVLAPLLSGQQERLAPVEQRFIKTKFDENNELLGDAVQVLQDTLSK